MNGQFIKNDLYEIIFSGCGDYVMQDITGIEDHQYQTITSDDKSNTCTLPSFNFFSWCVAVFLFPNIRPKIVPSPWTINWCISYNIFHIFIFIFYIFSNKQCNQKALEKYVSSVEYFWTLLLMLVFCFNF